MADTDTQKAPAPARVADKPGVAPIDSKLTQGSPVHTPSVDVNTDSVPAQTTGPAHETPTGVVVHETHVVMDRVITDPHDPLAVQVPAAGRGNAMTPIGHQWGTGTPMTPEDALAAKAKDSDKS